MMMCDAYLEGASARTLGTVLPFRPTSSQQDLNTDPHPQAALCPPCITGCTKHKARAMHPTCAPSSVMPLLRAPDGRLRGSRRARLFGGASAVPWSSSHVAPRARSMRGWIRSPRCCVLLATRAAAAGVMSHHTPAIFSGRNNKLAWSHI
jgi:hypothetical protein